MVASPKIGDVKALNKLARQLKSQPVKLQNGSSQRGMTVFSAEPREESWKDGTIDGSLSECECQKIQKTVSSLPWLCAVLFSWKCFGSCQFSPSIMDGHFRWSCKHSHEDWRKELGNNSQNNSFTWTKGDNPHEFPCCKKEACSGKNSWSCTHSKLRIVWQIVWRKASAKADNLITAVKKRQSIRC